MTRRTASRIAWAAWAVTLAFSIVHLALHAMTPTPIASATDAAFVLAWLGAFIAFQSFATDGRDRGLTHPCEPDRLALLRVRPPLPVRERRRCVRRSLLCTATSGRRAHGGDHGERSRG